MLIYMLTDIESSGSGCFILELENPFLWMCALFYLFIYLSWLYWGWIRSQWKFREIKSVSLPLSSLSWLQLFKATNLMPNAVSVPSVSHLLFLLCRMTMAHISQTLQQNFIHLVLTQTLGQLNKVCKSWLDFASCCSKSNQSTVAVKMDWVISRYRNRGSL